MIIFGSRSTLVRNKVINNPLAICEHCKSVNAFVLATYSRYFHIFWIPFFPLGKTNTLKCSHCKKSYSENNLSPNLRAVIESELKTDPPKTPKTHGCGCLIVAGFILFSIIMGVLGAIFGSGKTDSDKSDFRKELLKADKEKVTSITKLEEDSISDYLKDCIFESIKGIDTREIGYYTKIKHNSVLILLKVRDMKKIETSSRKELVYAVEDCFYALGYQSIKNVYIAVDGKWNMLMIKTPKEEDLSGEFADEDLLLPFYDEDLRSTH